MTDKGKELYEEVKGKIDQLSEDDSVYTRFGKIWKIGCLAKYRSFDLRFFYEDTNREFVEAHRDQLTKSREDFMNNIEDYVEKTIDIMKKTNKFRVFYAKTNEEAHEIVLNELGDIKVIYKSKSLEAKDIGILDVLKNKGIEIKETDLGDVLCQLFDYKYPSYSLGPGIQFTEEEIANKLKEKYGVEIEPTPEAIVDYYRKSYRKELLNDVKVSLTSANAIAADDGSIVLIENEGNISIITRATEKHIVLVGIQKIVSTVHDALSVVKIQQRITNVDAGYISFISSPSNTADIQGKKVLGMYGAKEVVVILVDDWRTKAVRENLFYKDIIKCISCKSWVFVQKRKRKIDSVCTNSQR